MNANEHIAVEDLALFALLLFSEEDAAAVRAHLSLCAGCREELRRVREDLATYALAVQPAEVPAGARDRFLTRLEAAPGRAAASSAAHAGDTPGPVLVGAPTRPRRVLPLVAWAGWLVAAAAVVIAVGLEQNRNALRAALGSEQQHSGAMQAEANQARRILDTLSDPSAVRVTLTAPKAPAAPTARATYQPKSGTLLMIANNLAPLGPDKVYELWLIPADGAAPIAAGTFSPDAHGNASLLVPRLGPAITAKAFGITAEPTGGSAAPTMPILLAGAPA